MGDTKNDAFYWRLHRTLRPLIQFYARPEIAGDRFALKTGGPVLLASNHAGHLWWDSLCLLACFTERPVGIIAHHWDATVAPLRIFLEKAGASFLSPDVTAIGVGDPVVARLKNGEAMAIYPEESYHTFRNRYTVFRFSPHVARYAELSGAPIVPVAVIGAEEAAACLAGYKKPGVPLHISLPLPPILPLKITLQFGEPVGYGALIEGAPHGLARPALWQYAADVLQERMLALMTPHRPGRARASDVRYIDHRGWW